MPRLTRRRALQTLPLVAGVGAGLAGCLSAGRAPSDATGPPEHPPAIPRESIDGTWPSNRYDATGRGYAPDVSGPVAPVGELWRAEVDAGETTPAVADGTVYLSGDGLIALDAATGDQRWQMDLGRTFKSSPVIQDDTVYVGFEETVFAVDTAAAADGGGAVRWRYTMPSDEITSPVIADGTVVVGSGDSGGGSGAVHAIDLDSGKRQWAQSVDDWLGTMPVVSDGRTFFGTTGGDLYAVRLDDGAEVWTRSLDADFFHTFAVADGTLYVPDDGGFLYAIDAETGETQWSTRVGQPTERNAEVFSSPVAVDDERVYVGAGDARLYAFDRESGESVWDFWAWNTVGSAPAVADETVYVGSVDTTLYALDAASGDVTWEFSTGGRLWRSTPAVVDEVVYIPADDHCYAVAARDEGDG